MKNTLIINKLENFISNDTISNQRQHYPDMYQPITDLINALKTEVYAEEKNNESYINRQKKAVSFLKKAGKNTYRPILKYSEIQKINGQTYQVFTDSYVVIALTEPLNLPDVSETDDHLPNIERLFNGCNFEKALAWTKKFDPDRITQYESARYRNYDETCDYSNLDVYSRMYPALSENQEYMDKAGRKPFLLVEYCHSMGNGPGDFEDYFQMIQDNDKMCGGFVWEWCDHAIAHGTAENGKKI